MARLVVPLVLCQVLAGCGLLKEPVLDNDLADDAAALEFVVDARGHTTGLAYAVDPQDVPQNVSLAMDRLHPGGPYAGAERHVRGLQVTWQLSRLVDGLRIDARFETDGTLVEEALELALEDAPETVRELVAERFPGGENPRWAKVRDGAGQLTAYHVRFQLDAQIYRVSLAPDGRILGLWRQLPATVDLPL